MVDAVGMEAHGSSVARAAQNLADLLPDVAARKVFEKVGVYGGAVDPMPMMDMFDKQIQLRMGQCNVGRWTDVLLPLVEDDAWRYLALGAPTVLLILAGAWLFGRRDITAA